MDLVMPGMDGFATTKAIRALSRVDALTIPIIAVTAVTANTYQDIEKEVHAAGMNACLPKPVHTKALIATLEQYKL